MGNCFFKVKYTVYWAMYSNILTKEWVANITKKYVMFVCNQKRGSIREDDDSVKCVGSEMILERLYI